jgi:hypothetical protein
MDSRSAPEAGTIETVAPSASLRFPWLAWLCASVLLVLLAGSFFSFRVDDAFIVLRYAWNLSHGLGMTFNPGERVEGFTCPALVVFEAAAMALHLDAFLATKVLGIASGIATLGLTILLALRLTRSAAVAAASGLLLAAQPSLAVACVSGLETAPFTACVLGALAASMLGRSRESAVLEGVLLAVAFLLRPDGAVAAVLILTMHSWRERKAPEGSRRLLLAVAAGACVAVPLMLWKASYFGAWVPNTALAKVPLHGHGRFLSGLTYLTEYSTSHLEILAASCLLLLALKDRAFRTPAILGLGWISYVVTTGGDWIPHARFLIPVAPLGALALAAGIGQLLPTGLRRPAWVTLPLVVAVAASADWTRIRQEVRIATESSIHGREVVGGFLRRAAPPRASVAILDVGAVGWESRLRIVDTGGLADRDIGRMMHEGSGTYEGHLFFPGETDADRIAKHVVDAKPEVIVLVLNDELPVLLGRTGSHPRVIQAAYPQDRAILKDPRLREQYRYVCSTPYNQGFGALTPAYNVFVRKDVPLREEPQPARDGRISCGT